MEQRSSETPGNPFTRIFERFLLVKPGERAAFRSRLASPPAEGRSIDVRFFTRRDIAGGSV